MKQLYKYITPLFVFTLALLLCTNTYAVNYTTVSSGNFSSKSTWQGGMVPPSTLKAGDKITISIGLNVNLDENLLLILAATLEVNGTLSGGSGRVLQVTNGTLVGTGNINIDSISCSSLSGLTFSGSYNVNAFYTTNAMLTSGAFVTVNKSLTLAGGTMTMANGVLNIGNGGTIEVSTGSLVSTGGTINLNTPYNVRYTGANSSSGIELGGSGLGNIEVDMPGTNEVSLSTDMNVNGTLTLTSGTLKLNGNSLSFGAGGNLASAGSGKIEGSAGSDIEVMSTNGLTGTLNFTSNGNMLDDLTINCGSTNGVVKIGGELNVLGEMFLTSGKLDIGNNRLRMGATSKVTGGSDTSYVITEGGGMLVMPVTGGSTETFHVGTDNNYAPCIMKSKTGSLNTDLFVSCRSDVKYDGETGSTIAATQPVVNATWVVETSVSNNVEFEMEVWWDPSMEVNTFNRAKAFISKYTSGSWDAQTIGAASTASYGMYKISRTGIKSFSAFAVFDDKTAASVNNIKQTEEGMVLYPNPARNTLNLNHGGYAHQEAVVTIYNTLGQEVYQETINSNNASIDLTDMKAGLYFLYLKSDNAVHTQQFVKQ